MSPQLEMLGLDMHECNCSYLLGPDKDTNRGHITALSSISLNDGHSSADISSASHVIAKQYFEKLYKVRVLFRTFRFGIVFVKANGFLNTRIRLYSIISYEYQESNNKHLIRRSIPGINVVFLAKLSIQSQDSHQYSHVRVCARCSRNRSE